MFVAIRRHKNRGGDKNKGVGGVLLSQTPNAATGQNAYIIGCPTPARLQDCQLATIRNMHDDDDEGPLGFAQS